MKVRSIEEIEAAKNAELEEWKNNRFNSLMDAARETAERKFRDKDKAADWLRDEEERIREDILVREQPDEWRRICENYAEEEKAAINGETEI